RSRRGRPRRRAHRPVGTPALAAGAVDFALCGVEGGQGGGQGGALGGAAVAEVVEQAGERREPLARLAGGGAPALARALARGRGGRRGSGGRGGRWRGGRLAARLHDLDLPGPAEHHLGPTLEALDAARRPHAPALVEALRLAARALEERQPDDDTEPARIFG